MRRCLLAVVVMLTAAFPLVATESNPSARQRALIEKLLVQMNIEANTSAMSDAMYAQMQKYLLDNAAAKGNDPEHIAEAKELFEAFRVRAAKIEIAPLMRDEFVRIYAKYFTEQELADLVAFYSTATGSKSIKVMPDLMNEGMQVGIKLLAPKIEEAMAQAIAEHEKKRPWRRTMSDIRSVATALEAYALDHQELYPVTDYAGLEDILKEYLAQFPEKDIWGHPYAYVVSADGKHFALVSAGADTNFEWDSRRIVPLKAEEEVSTRYRERLEDDIIFVNGGFAQLPLHAKNENW